MGSRIWALHSPRNLGLLFLPSWKRVALQKGRSARGRRRPDLSPIGKIQRLSYSLLSADYQGVSAGSRVFEVMTSSRSTTGNARQLHQGTERNNEANSVCLFLQLEDFQQYHEKVVRQMQEQLATATRAQASVAKPEPPQKGLPNGVPPPGAPIPSAAIRGPAEVCSVLFPLWFSINCFKCVLDLPGEKLIHSGPTVIFERTRKKRLASVSCLSNRVDSPFVLWRALGFPGSLFSPSPPGDLDIFREVFVLSSVPISFQFVQVPTVFVLSQIALLQAPASSFPGNRCSSHAAPRRPPLHSFLGTTLSAPSPLTRQPRSPTNAPGLQTSVLAISASPQPSNRPSSPGSAPARPPAPCGGNPIRAG